MKNKGRVRGPLLGAHMSIAGGVGNAFIEGKKVNCDAIQIFTKSSRQWASKPYSKEEIEQARQDWMEGSAFGEVKGYDGDPLSAPELPPTPLKPRGRAR